MEASFSGLKISEANTTSSTEDIAVTGLKGEFRVMLQLEVSFSWTVFGGLLSILEILMSKV